jgi:uncharacterized membrane protein
MKNTQKSPTTSTRLWELDALRGITILLMVAFHVVFDLRYFFGFKSLSYSSGFWFYEGKLSAILFIGLTGMVSSLLYHRYNGSKLRQKMRMRGLRLIGLGMLITAVTWMIFDRDAIWFGILHFLGVSMLLSIPFLRFRWVNVGLAGLMFYVGWIFDRMTVNHWWFMIFGIRPNTFHTLDYYPLLPWFGVSLMGIAIGNFLYSKNFPLIQRRSKGVEKTFIWLGQYSLWIYLIHQPIMLGALWMVLNI